MSGNANDTTGPSSPGTIPDPAISDRRGIETALHLLEGYLRGIALDGIITEDEADGLRHWLVSNARFGGLSPFDEVRPVLERAVNGCTLPREERLDLLWLCGSFKSGNRYHNAVMSDIQRLHGLFSGILADGRISAEEVRNLSAWLEEAPHMTGAYPYDEIKSIISAVLADGAVDRPEQQFLKAFFARFVDTAGTTGVDPLEIRLLRQQIAIPAICALGPALEFRGRTFCLAGRPVQGTAAGFADAVRARGGIVMDEVEATLHYLVAGDAGNPVWAFACSGRKVEQALELRQAGKKILIVAERDFWAAVGQAR
jgi:hypothetical protein